MSKTNVSDKLIELSDIFINLKVPSNIKIEDVSDISNIENLHKFATVSYKDTNSNNVQNRLVWSQPLQHVVCPIILKNGSQYFFLLSNQSRAIFSGKVSIEVYRGWLSEISNDANESNLWNSLLGRKLKYLTHIAKIVDIVELGSPKQHPDLTPDTMPIQLVFAETLEHYDLPELKKSLKTKHDYDTEPKSGPPLHNNDPVIKSLEEIQNRIVEIQAQPDKTNEEFYINDAASYVAINRTLDYINKFGYPYDR